MSASRAARLLLDLLETCERGELGFRAAAEGVEDPPLRRLLESYAEQRAAFAQELRRELSGLGAEAAAGALREVAPLAGASRLADPVSPGDESAIIAKCARGEDTTMSAYRQALGSAGAVVERQYLQVRDAHDHLRSLEEARASAA